jgi:predicted nucleic acid-binding protein
MKVIVDTGFLSSLAKIDRLELITEFFGVEGFSVPTQVIDELKKSEVYELVSDEIIREESDGSIRTEIIEIDYSQLDYSRERYGKGEIACIELPGEEDVVLIDDRDAKRLARQEGKSCYDLPTFLLSCKKKGLLDKEEMQKVLKDLENEDHYRFTDEMEEKLLDK